MNRLSIVETSENDLLSRVEPPRKKSLLTIGGCNSFEIFNHMVDLVEFTHFWRGTVPTVMSPAIKLQNADFESDEFSRLLEREVSKVIYQRIVNASDSIIVFEAASDFATDVLQIDDTIISDIRNEIYNPSFKDIVFHEKSQLSRAQALSTDSQFYWDLWRYYFEIMYREVLKERIERGVDVLFLSRRFCVTELRDGEFYPLQNARVISTRNRILDEIDDFISCYPGVKIIRSEISLEFTSADAAWGGPWEFHPHNAYYADMRAKFLETIFPEQKRGIRYLGNWLAEDAQKLSKANTALARLELEIGEAKNTLGETQNDRDRLAERVRVACEAQESLQLALNGKQSENDQLRQSLDVSNFANEKLEKELEIERARVRALQNTVEAVEAGKTSLDRDLETIREERNELEQRLTELAIIRQTSQEVSEALKEELSRAECALKFVASRYTGRSGGMLNRLLRQMAIVFDMKQLRKFGFSEESYLAENFDVRASGIRAARHYLVYGMKERRNFTKNL